MTDGSRARGLNAADVAIALDDAQIADVVALVRSARGRAHRGVSGAAGRAAVAARLVAHNLEDRSLEVIRMARSLARQHGAAKESQYTAEFESADLLTLGIVYEKASRFAGGAYSSLSQEGGPIQRPHAYVVARINPVRFHKSKKGDTAPPMPMAQALTRMAAAVKNFKVDSVSNADLAWVAVGAGAQE